EWVHVQLHQQKGMISLSPPTICNSAAFFEISCVTAEAVIQEQARMSARTAEEYFFITTPSID
ncbi:hypothetical protein, partial [Escherichia coli]|uniref:hypothetical protein n=1 Tax=Escherichia coli TaxID=562 RepID=UPI001F494D95